MRSQPPHCKVFSELVNERQILYFVAAVETHAAPRLESSSINLSDSFALYIASVRVNVHLLYSLISIKYAGWRILSSEIRASFIISLSLSFFLSFTENPHNKKHFTTGINRAFFPTALACHTMP